MTNLVTMDVWTGQILPWLIAGSPHDIPEEIRRQAEHLTETGVRGTPVSLYSRWQAAVVLPVALDLCDAAGDNRTPILRVMELHRQESASREDWEQALPPYLTGLFRRGYNTTTIYEQSHASAMLFGQQNSQMIIGSFGSITAYADYYADLNARSSADLFAEANARVQTPELAHALATRNPDLLAATLPISRLKSLLQSLIKISINQKETEKSSRMKKIFIKGFFDLIN